jgi:hypothetical protein
VNSIAAAFPSKSTANGETLPSYFFSELLKDVAHHPDPFTFTAFA